MASFLKLLFGILTIFVIGLVSIKTQLLPGSLRSAQHRLQFNSEHALTAIEGSWASVTLDGQKAVLHGVAPSEEASAEAAQVISKASGAGGVLIGGVTSVDRSAVRYAAPALVVASSPEKEDRQENASLEDPLSQAVVAAEPEDTSAKKDRCDDKIRTFSPDQPITFAYARNTLGPISRAYLSDLADILKVCPNATLELTGHSDSTGNTKRNQRLSLNRAETAADYLRSIGVDNTQLRALGVGSIEPRHSNATAEGRANNRRVEFDIKNEHPQD